MRERRRRGGEFSPSPDTGSTASEESEKADEARQSRLKSASASPAHDPGGENHL